MNSRGASRGILLPTPATIVGLQAAAASSFQVDLPLLSTTSPSTGPGNDLSFTFKDAQGDDIVFRPKPDHIHYLAQSMDSQASLVPPAVRRLCQSVMYSTCITTRQRISPRFDRTENNCVLMGSPPGVRRGTGLVISEVPLARVTSAAY